MHNKPFLPPLYPYDVTPGPYDVTPMRRNNTTLSPPPQLQCLRAGVQKRGYCALVQPDTNAQKKNMPQQRIIRFYVNVRHVTSDQRSVVCMLIFLIDTVMVIARVPLHTVQL